MEMHRVLIGLGTNVESRSDRIKEAAIALNTFGTVTHKSSVYETEPIGVKDQASFLNAVVLLETELGATDLLEQLKALETELGREKRERWHEREIDFDILFYDDLVMETPQFCVPHPEAHHRLFALVPLAEICPNFAHPVLHRTIEELAQALLLQSGNKVEKTSIAL